MCAARVAYGWQSSGKILIMPSATCLQTLINRICKHPPVSFPDFQKTQNLWDAFCAKVCCLLDYIDQFSFLIVKMLKKFIWFLEIFLQTNKIGKLFFIKYVQKETYNMISWGVCLRADEAFLWPVTVFSTWVQHYKKKDHCAKNNLEPNWLGLFIGL